MLDQNTTIILSTLITLVGTLGGAIAGVVLTNRHTTKLEELKIKQEQSKRKTTVIEEVYSLLIRINDLDMDNLDNQQFLANGTRDDLNRVRTLVLLYLPSVKNKLDAFLGARLMLGLDNVLDIDMAKQIDKDEIKMDVFMREPFQHYHASLNDVYQALEALVR